MRKAIELELEVIQLDGQVFLLDKNSESSMYVYDPELKRVIDRGLFAPGESDIDIIASTNRLGGTPLLVIEDRTYGVPIEEKGLLIDTKQLLQVRHGVDWYDLPYQHSGSDPEGIYRKIPVPNIEKGELKAVWVDSKI